MAEQKKAEEFGITEDDVSEIRQDINKFRSVFPSFPRKLSVSIQELFRDIQSIKHQRRVGRIVGLSRNIFYSLWFHVMFSKNKDFKHT